MSSKTPNTTEGVKTTAKNDSKSSQPANKKGKKESAPEKTKRINWVAVWVGFSIFLIGQDRILGAISLVASIYVLYKQSRVEKEQ